MIEIQENTQILPLCPHCKKELNLVYTQEIAGMFGKRYIYFCPSCRAALGVSHRKGFWMG